MDSARYLQLVLTEMYGWDNRDADLWPIHTSLITDCDSLWSNTRSLTTHVKERALLRELSIFREALAQGVIEEFRWIPTNVQLADSLTKIMDAHTLINAIKTGIIRLRPSHDELLSKKGSLKMRFIHQLPVELVQRGRTESMLAWLETCFVPLEKLQALVSIVPFDEWMA